MLPIITKLFTKNTSEEESRQGQQPIKVEVYKPRFKTLTLDHLPKNNLPSPEIYVQEAIEVRGTEAGSPQASTFALVDGPQKFLPARHETLHTASLSDAQSCAASILSPSAISLISNTPHSAVQRAPAHDWTPTASGGINRIDDVSPTCSLKSMDQTVNRISIVTDPFSDNASGPYIPNMGTSQDPLHVAESSTADPSLHQAVRSSIRLKHLAPKLNTSFLTPGPYTPSPRSANTTNQKYFSAKRTSDEYVSTLTPENSHLRYSYCGVNPFEELNENQKKERESSAEVADLWDMILGKVRDAEQIRKSIQIDDNYNQSLTTAERLQKLPATTPLMQRADENNVLIDYYGCPQIEHNTASSPLTLLPSAKPGMSPSELNTAARAYLATLEAEIADLKRYKLEREQLEQAQLRGDHVDTDGGLSWVTLQEIPAFFNDVQKPLKRDTAYEDSLVKMSKDPNEQHPEDRRSVMTVWPDVSKHHSEVPPVPSIPPQLQQTAVSHNNPFVNVTSCPISDHSRGERLASPLESSRDVSPSPVNSTLSPSMNENYVGRKSTSVETIVDFYLPTPLTKRADASFTNVSEEKGALTINTDCDLPPPYTPSPEQSRQSPPNKITRALSHALRSTGSRNGRREPKADTQPVSNDGRRFPIKPQDLPRLQITTTKFLHFDPQPTTKSPGVFTEVAFTPTTPYQARNDIMQARTSQPHYQITMSDISFRNQQPHQVRSTLEKKRRRQERREKLMGRGGWFWLCGLCCGVNKMNRKQKMFWSGFLIMILIIVAVLATFFELRKDQGRKRFVISNEGPQFVTLANFPRLPVGNVTITPRLTVNVNTCVSPSTLWSCSLPPPLAANALSGNPTFIWNIQANNGSTQRPRSNPSAPNVNDYRNVSSIEGIRIAPLEGEETGFYVSWQPSNTSFLTSPPSNLNNDKLLKPDKRGHARSFTYHRVNTTFTFNPFNPTSTSTPTASSSPQTSSNPNPTGAINNNNGLPPSPNTSPAKLLPVSYISQPLRFFNRGLPTEHFAFQTYFNKTIYVRSIDTITSNSGLNLLDSDGGVSPSEARFVCQFTGTRFITKIWTKPNVTDPATGMKKVIIDPVTLGIISSSTQSGGQSSGGGTANVNAGGMGGYPVTVEEDRAGTKTGLIQCWSIDGRGNVDPASMKYVLERQGINTGERGCQCQWNNWKSSNDGT